MDDFFIVFLLIWIVYLRLSRKDKRYAVGGSCAWIDVSCGIETYINIFREVYRILYNLYIVNERTTYRPDLDILTLI